MAGLFFLVLLINLALGICFTYKVKNAVLRWSLIIIPPLFIIPLYWVPWDIVTIFLWILAGIAFLWAILSLIINIVRIIFRKLQKKPQVDYVKLRFIRPVLTVVIFLSVNFFVKQSLRSADEYAKETAKKIQAEANASGICPTNIQSWEVDKWTPDSCIIMYGKYGTKYRLRYSTLAERKEFVISVHHNIDEGFFVSGGVDKPLKATYSGPSNSVDVPIE